MTAERMRAFAVLLDRSVARIAELSADGRRFDRRAVVGLADIWDNSTFPLFDTALLRPSWLRERRAAAALRWMADGSPARRAWMIEQAAGHRLESLLPEQRDQPAHVRDYKGDLRPGVVPLTAAAAAGTARDYDLTGARVRTVHLERGEHGIHGYLWLEAPRRYPAPDNAGEAIVEVMLEDVREARFDTGDGSGTALTVDDDGVEVRVGARGRFGAASARVGFDDDTWHLSGAGRDAAAADPRGRAFRREPIGWPPARGAARDTALVVHQAMLELRSVRYASNVGSVRFGQLCAAFAGAGTGVLAAAGRPRRVRDRAFRELAEGWIAASPCLADRITDRFPDGHWARAAVPAGDPPPPPAAAIPGRAELTLVHHVAAHVRFDTQRDASTIVNLAVPDGDGPWTPRALEFERTTAMSIGTPAIAGPHPVAHTAGRSLSFTDGSFSVA
ncbi:hypothetical protein [Dactylosporangium sp. NPDC006015]|uniref:hypothetical protein n=1 Tax=Dactylosporangium sp. NPDC006015 TaxID=3154576 RepID=UPI0033A17832